MSEDLAEASFSVISNESVASNGCTDDSRPQRRMSRSIPRGPNVYTLYFVRHGEAAHNVLEKAAANKAKQEAVAEGYTEDTPETKHRMEEARKAVLNDPTLQDCPLTALGKEEAAGARDVVQKLVDQRGMPAPTEVLVSPLTRALETADLVFPHHDNIHVRAELQERRTGKACDMRASSVALSRNPAYQRFSFKRLRLSSIARLDLPLFADMFEYAEMDEMQISEAEVEEQHMLRGRTQLLFDLLAESDHRVVAVVTHKGYLRELERGPFAQTEAKEFKNCEIRVYRAHFEQGSHFLEAVERLV